MSNYPPGVTGREYEIAGPDHEWYDEDWVCTNSTEYVLLPRELLNKIEYFFSAYKDDIRLEFIQSILKERLAHMSVMISDHILLSPEVAIKQCKNQGAEKQSYKGRIFWECSECGKDYEDWVDDRD